MRLYSHNNMIIKLTGNIIFEQKQPFIIKRTIEEKLEINNIWEEFIKEKIPSDYYNGDIFLVTNIKTNEGNYIFEIGKTKFSDLIYAKRTNKLKVRSLFIASYIMTADNYLCIIKNKHKRINTRGGRVDSLDFDNNLFIPQNCLYREFQEEMAMDLKHDETFYDINAKYIKIPYGAEHELALYPIGILYEIKTTLTTTELLENFKKNKDFSDGEIEELVFYNKNTYQQIEQYEAKESYISELLTHIINDQ